jgi:hypothetical protein
MIDRLCSPNFNSNQDRWAEEKRFSLKGTVAWNGFWVYSNPLRTEIKDLYKKFSLDHYWPRCAQFYVSLCQNGKYSCIFSCLSLSPYESVAFLVENSAIVRKNEPTLSRYLQYTNTKNIILLSIKWCKHIVTLQRRGTYSTKNYEE